MSTVDAPPHDPRCISWRSNDPTACDCRDQQGHTRWCDGPWLGFDLETTGVDVAHDRIVTATVITYEPGGQPIARTWLADPEIDIPDEAAGVHGVTTEHAREHGRPAADVVAEIRAALAEHWRPGVPLIGYNVQFDLTLHAYEQQRHGLPVLGVPGPVIDPRVIDKAIDPYRRGVRQLTDVCQHYRVRLDAAHDATEDALGVVRVAWRIGQRHPVGRLPAAELHALQGEWYAHQQRSFADYLRQKVAPNVTDPAERQDVLARADDITAAAGDGWPIPTALLNGAAV